MHLLQISLKRTARTSEIAINRGSRRDLGRTIRRRKQFSPRRILVISNERVFGLYGQEIVASLRSSEYQVFEFLIPEGERYKSFRVLEQIVLFLAQNRFERNDLVVALGGGVVGDVAGFAAAIYLRGIQFIQVPTTLLAQVDSSVGGKTAVNLPVGKNMVGAFYQPPLVVIDTETLSTLPDRELVAGFCEMVKQSLVSSRVLFESTSKLLRTRVNEPDIIASAEFDALIAAHCKFKASIVANDEKEATDRIDKKSRRILNFGHTTAHALEAITNYRLFRHGEAVGYGMLVAGELSKNLGLLSVTELDSLRESVRLCGPLPKASHLSIDKIARSLQHDKKSVSGQINWVLLERVGSPKIVPGSQISAKALSLSLRTGLQSFGRQKDKSH